MRFTEEELEQHMLDRLQAKLQQLMVEMELHQNQDSPADFERWWITEGRIGQYFSMKQELEKRVSSMQRRKLLRQQKQRALQAAAEEQRVQEAEAQEASAAETEVPEKVRKIRWQG